MHYYYVIYGENYYRRAGSPVAYNDTIHRSEKQSKKPENFTARAGSQTSPVHIANGQPPFESHEPNLHLWVWDITFDHISLICLMRRKFNQFKKIVFKFCIPFV